MSGWQVVVQPQLDSALLVGLRLNISSCVIAGNWKEAEQLRVLAYCHLCTRSSQKGDGHRLSGTRKYAFEEVKQSQGHLQTCGLIFQAFKMVSRNDHDEVSIS